MFDSLLQRNNGFMKTLEAADTGVSRRYFGECVKKMRAGARCTRVALLVRTSLQLKDFARNLSKGGSAKALISTMDLLNFVE